MSNVTLKIFDGNGWYWANFEEADHNEVGRCIAIEIENTSGCREGMKVPDETTIIIAKEDVKYLISYLNTFLNHL